MKNEKGFSLVELLVVVIIIAIIAAIAIPNLLASRRAANEASAISALRTIHSAEITYFSTTGSNAGYAVLAGLLTDQLIDSQLAGATAAGTAKSGYFYTAAHAAGATTYCFTANPASAGVTGTGVRNFAVSTNGVIFTSSPDGTTTPAACSAAPFTASGANPIQ
jgi:prepilin-type N-terminal cleavage/methylation domain-containing protein